LRLLVPDDDNLALALQDDLGFSPIFLNASRNPDVLAPAIGLRIRRKFTEVGGEDHGREIGPPVRREVQKAHAPRVLRFDNGAFDSSDLAAVIGSVLHDALA
jgi:hypothetical protein